MELRGKDGQKRFPRPMTECAQCGAVIFVSSWSEYVSEHRVRDLWECNACGYTFETEVVFAAEQRDAA